MLEAFFYFVAGAIVHSILVKLLEYYYVANTFYITNYSCLTLAKYAEGIYIKTLKLSRTKTLESKQITEEEEKFLEGVDNKMVEDWKMLFIITMINMYPPYLRKQLPFTNWREAMNWMQKVDKKYKIASF